MEYINHFENEQCTAPYVKLNPQERTAFHYDLYPAIVVALAGGTVTRIEADGSRTYVDFPTGIPIYLSAETPDKIHRTINEGATPIELIIVQLK